ncbi:MAG: dienelactone hydrolase family protein [Beijerinckiaceae bacterium]|jgi:carboxymethylenebutenolidase|nr:dienelactone hydrolase family protein [Beijerinckiaceae bacterium]
MPPITQAIVDLYDRFTHGALSRREFMERLAASVGGTAAATALLPLLQNNYAVAQTVAENDPRIATSTFQYEIGDAMMQGLLAWPAGEGRWPGVVVIHENRGLNPHIRDVTRRYALDGFIAFGIDALTPEGGTPADEDKARDLIGTVPPDRAAARLAAGVAALARAQSCNGKVGTVGYCWGGGMVNRIAVLNPPGLAAGVSYYGSQVPAEQVERIRTPLMLHYAGNDERINAGIPAFRAALEWAKKPHEIHVYEGAQHAFNNDTNAARYNKAAADLALSRTLAFFRHHLA